jgi:hypothetical protein
LRGGKRLGQLGHMDCKSLSQARKKQQSRKASWRWQDRMWTEADDRHPKQQENDYWASAFFPLPENRCPAATGQGRADLGEKISQPSLHRRVAGAAARGSSWCPFLEPNGCVCLNPTPLEPPRLAGGLIRQKEGNTRGVGS